MGFQLGKELKLGRLGSLWMIRLIVVVARDRKFKFALVGGLTFLMAFAIMIGLVEALKVNENYAFWAKEIICINFKFLLVYFYAWAGIGSIIWWSWLKFVSSMTATGVLSSFVFYWLNTSMEWHYLLAFPLTTIVIMVFNYFVIDRMAITDGRIFNRIRTWLAAYIKR